MPQILLMLTAHVHPLRNNIHAMPVATWTIIFQNFSNTRAANPDWIRLLLTKIQRSFRMDTWQKET